MTMMRRLMISLLVTTTLVCSAGLAWSGSYLNRAALLISASRAERDMVLPRSGDKELLRMVHSVAQARTEAAHNMAVPKLVAAAHPHLMLVLENSERGYAAALENNQQRFVQHILRARGEDKTFRAVLKNLGYTLPRVK